MKSYYYLLRFAFNGIKNIENRIELEFYKKTIDKTFDPEKYRVKAIYGENGSGKTAIITAVKIMKELILSDDYLTDSINQAKLHKIVNIHTNKVEMSMDFIKRHSYETDENSIVYRFEIEIEPNDCGKYEIVKETLLAKTGEYSASKFRIIYECRNGIIISAAMEDDAYNVILKQSANLLTSKSLTRICLDRIADNLKLKGAADFYKSVLDLLYVSFNINVSLEESDQHEEYFINKEFELVKSNSDVEASYRKMLRQMDLKIKNGRKSLYKDLYDGYKDEVAKLENFIKLFKRDLISIEIDKKENGLFYETSLVMNYGEYSIDSEFESTGIKKLIRLFNYLNYAASGGIVFIDEMDSNINDVYLAIIIEFIVEYGRGQLCFTTHNTSPMSVLRKNKKSIDFISTDNRIINWVSNGNFAPESLYRQGMIEYLPFNVEPEDFIGVLEG